MPRRPFVLAALAASVSAVPLFAQPATTKATESKHQTLCLPETDPSSPRKSKLAGNAPNPKELIFTDVDNDGDPDVLETWLNGKRVRWFDENDDLRPTDVRGDQSGDALQVDRDGDGYYDGPGDISIKWCDDDGDGKADAQIFAANPAADAPRIYSGLSHFMVFIDTDKDGVNGYIPWDTFGFHRENWRVKPTTSPTHTIPPPNFSPDYMGNSIFLKQHLPAWAVTDIRLNWENPFAFYDFDGDGVTEMSIRFLDVAPHRQQISSPEPYSGKITEAMGGWDLDNDSTKGNEFDFDMSWKFTSATDGKAGETIDYTQYSDKHPKMVAPGWVLDGKYFRYDNWRRIEDFCYVTHDRCFDEMWKTNWRDCWIVFDEDDDDQRWERVELYYPVDSPDKIYNIQKWKGGPTSERYSIMGHTQADSLGDRGEWDKDNSGRGKVYVGRFDGKLHLFGAESGAWLVDKDAKYWGGTPVVLGVSSPERATKAEEVVQYFDTDGNGYFDRITYDYDGDKTVDTEVSLLDYKTAQNPHPDVADLVNPHEKKWEGMAQLFKAQAERSFDDGLVVYRAAWKKGLTDAEIDDLSFASSTGEKYHCGYWMRERVFRAVDRRLAAAGDEKSKQLRTDLKRLHFMGDTQGMAALIDGL